MDGCEERSHGRPLQEGLSPVGALDDVLRLILFIVPEDTNVVATVHDELITATTGRVLEPPSQVLTLGEIFNLRSVVSLIDTALASVALDVTNLVDAQNVLLVERSAVELAGGGSGFSGRRVFDEGEAEE